MAVLANDRNEVLNSATSRIVGGEVYITTTISAAFTVAKDASVATPSSITLSAGADKYTSPTYTWYRRIGGTGNFVLINGATSANLVISGDFQFLYEVGANSLVEYKVICTQTGVNTSEAIITIPVLREGTNAVVAGLSTSSFLLPAATDGTVSSFAAAETSFITYNGITNATDQWSYYVSATGGGISYQDSDDITPRTATGPADGGLGGVNLLTNSNVVTAGTGTTFVANQTVGPDGTTTMGKLVASATTGGHISSIVYAWQAGVTYTLSGYVKSDNSALITGFNGEGASNIGSVGLINYSFTTNTGSGGVFTQLQNGLVKFTVTFTPTATATVAYFIRLTSNGSTNFTGNDTSGIFIGSLQLETGSVANEYAPTNGVARSGTRGYVKIVALTQDSSYLDITATKIGYTSITRRLSVAKSKQGLPGVAGTRTGILDLYQWSSTVPGTFPTGNSTYTWATGQFTAPATLNNWTTTPGTATAGQTLYIARQIYADTGTSASSVVTWNVTSSMPISAAGSSGTNGTRTAFLEVYQWSATVPTGFPSGTSTYTWSTGAFSAPTTPNSWSLTPGSATAGQTLYACSVRYADTGTSLTSSVTWNTTTAYAVGAAGTNGTNGTSPLVYDIVTSAPVITKDAVDAATTGTYSSITIQGKKYDGNTTTNFGWVTVTANGDTEAITATDTASAVFTLSPTTTAGKSSYTIKLYNQATVAGATLLDTQVIYVVYKGLAGANGAAGAAAIAAILSNEAHVLPANATGAVSSYTGSGTQIRVYEGATELTYDGTGTANSTWKVVVTTATNITAGTITDSGTYATVAAGSGVADATDTASILFTITGKNSAGTSFTITKQQTLSKSKQGISVTGATGQSNHRIYIASASSTTIPSTPSNTVSGAVPAGWSLTPVTLGATEAQFQSDGVTPAGSTTTTWGAPYLSYFKVAKLSAITADIGDITAGSLNINSGIASIDNAGNANFKSIVIRNSAGTAILTAGTTAVLDMAAANPINPISTNSLNLVRNGSAQLGNNANFTGGTYVSNDGYRTLGCYESVNGYQLFKCDEVIPVDVTKTYKTKVAAKSVGATGLSLTYLMFICLDKDYNEIYPANSYHFSNTRTSLAADLVNGATTITVASATNWDVTATTSNKKIGINIDGYPAYTYAKTSLYYNSISGNVITLSAAYSGPTIKAGTPCANYYDAGTYNYNMLSGGNVPATWTEYTGTMTPIQQGTYGTYANSEFRHGTAYVKIGALLNYGTAANSGYITRLDDFSIEPAPVIGDLGYTGSLSANNTYLDANGNIQGVSSGAGTSVNNAVAIGALTTSNGGILPNWNLDLADLSGKPAGIVSVEGIADRTGVAFGDSTNSWINISHPSDTTVSYGFPATAIDDASAYVITVRHKTNQASPPTTGLHLYMCELNTTLPQGKTHIGGNTTPYDTAVTPRTSAQYMWNNLAYPNNTGWVEQTLVYYPTLGTKFASFCMANWNNATTTQYHLDAVQIYQKTPSLYIQAAQPSGGTYLKGDTWVDSDATPTVTYVYTGSAWQAAANNSTEVGGTGVNVCNPRYTTFEEAALPPVSVANGTATLDTTTGFFGTKSLKLTATAGDNYCYLGNTSTDYNFPITPGKKWLVSAFVKSSAASAAGQFYLRTNVANTHYGINFTTSGTANTWTRVSGIADLTADTSTLCIARVDNDAGNTVTMNFDGIMVEAVIGASTTPSPFIAPPNFLETYTGSLTANNTSVDANGAIQGVSSGEGTTVSNSQITVNASGVLSGIGTSNVVVDNTKVDIGGTNLVKNSLTAGFASSITGPVTVSVEAAVTLPDGTTGQVLKLVTGDTAGVARIYNCLRANDVYSLSTYHKVSAGTASIGLDAADVGLSSISATTAWQWHKQEGFNVANYTLATYNFIDINIPINTTLYFWHPKVEFGNKATDWTPAPEDVAAGISTAATTATWSGVTGTGRPEDNATYGANWASTVTNRPESPNLLRLGAFSSATTGWSGGGGVLQSSASLSGNILENATYIMAQTGRDNYENSNIIPVTTGETIWFSGYVNNQYGNVAANFGYRRVLNGVEQNDWPTGTVRAANTAGWTYFKHSLVIPANCTGIIPFAQMGGTSNFGTTYWSNLRITREEPSANNTYIDTSGNIQGVSSGTGLSVSNNVDSIIRAPGGGLYVTSTNAHTGALKITLPQSWTNTMMRFTVEVYEYLAGYMCTIEIGGYNYAANTSWYNTSARVIGSSTVEYPVYFGHDGNKCCIWIGAYNETWSYPQVRVRDFFAGYSNYGRANWESGWVVGFDTTQITSGTGTNKYSASILDTLPGADWAKNSNRPANLSGLSGTEAIQNTQISITSGVISGIGNGAGTTIDNSYVPYGQNLIPNSDQTSAVTWGGLYNPNSANIQFYNSYASNYWDTSNYVLQGSTTRNLAARQISYIAGGDSALVFDVYPTGGWSAANWLPAVPGQKYIFSCYVQSHRCYAGLGIQFFNSSGGVVLAIDPSPVATNGESNANSLSYYTRLQAIGTAPVGTTLIGLYLRKYNTLNNAGDSYIWYAAPMFEAVPVNVSSPSPYMPGPASNTRQLGYSGDLNATYGADWSTNVVGAGTVNTNISNAATTATWTGVSGTGKPSDNANNTSVDANGAIQGVSSGAGTVVNNALVRVGGVNLMPNSGRFTSTEGWTSNGSTVSLDTSTTYAGYSTLKLVGLNGATNNKITRLKANTEYTISALVKGSSALSGSSDSNLHIQSWRDEDTGNVHQDTSIAYDQDITTSWKVVYQTFKTPVSANATYCRFYFYPLAAGYTLNIAYVKLEEGNKVTDWSVADALSRTTSSVLSATVSVDATSGAGFRAGNLTWDASGNRTGGAGVAMTPGGIIGHNGTTTTFAIDATTGAATFNGSGTFNGNGTFSGALSAASGTFAGELQAATGTFSGTLTAGTIDITSLVGQAYQYLNAGTYTFSPGTGMTKLKVTLVGGGGGGGGGGSSGGGGGGRYTGTFTVTPGNTYTVIVGGGGAGGLASNNYPGSAGASSTVTGTGVSGATAGGGGGGGTTGGAGGSGTTAGSAGGNRNAVVDGYTGIAQYTYAGAGGASGGNSGAGGAAPSITPVSQAYGRPGGLYGGGGSGASWHGVSGTTYQPGGVGANGRAVIEVSNPNGVVSRPEWDTLTSALIRQNIQIV